MLAEHLPALEAALRAYDALGELAEAAKGSSEAGRERAALAAFREAFYMATSDVNSRDHAFLVHPDDGYGFARRMLFRAGFDPGVDADARRLRGWGW